MLSPTRFVLNDAQTVQLTDETILEGGGRELLTPDRAVVVAGFLEEGELIAEILSFPDA